MQILLSSNNPQLLKVRLAPFRKLDHIYVQAYLSTKLSICLMYIFPHHEAINYSGFLPLYKYMDEPSIINAKELLIAAGIQEPASSACIIEENVLIDGILSLNIFGTSLTAFARAIVACALFEALLYASPKPKEIDRTQLNIIDGIFSNIHGLLLAPFFHSYLQHLSIYTGCVCNLVNYSRLDPIYFKIQMQAEPLEVGEKELGAVPKDIYARWPRSIEPVFIPARLGNRLRYRHPCDKRTEVDGWDADAV